MMWWAIGAVVIVVLLALVILDAVAQDAKGRRWP